MRYDLQTTQSDDLNQRTVERPGRPAHNHQGFIQLKTGANKMDYQIDLTQIIIALIVVFAPAIISAVRSFYVSWKQEQPDLAYRIEQAAEFGVKAAQTLKETGIWTDEKGKQAEAHAVNVAESFLFEQGIKVDLALILSAVRAVWQDSTFKINQPQG